MVSSVDKEIIDYVEQNIIPKYSGFDKAHREEHVRTVIDQSLKLAGQMPDCNPDMVYIIAAFHDLGLAFGRERHHIDSRKILESDNFLKSRFTSEQIHIMGEAVEDHRASSKNKTRSQYGLIVAEADRIIDPETIMRRTIQYSLSHYPELDRIGHFHRTVQHLNEKYGPEGYLKIWIPGSDNAIRLKGLHKILSNSTQTLDLFNRIYDEESL